MVVTAYVVIFAIAVLEAYQRITDYLCRRKETKNPYFVRFETAGGHPVFDKGGPLAFVHHPHLTYKLQANQHTGTFTINAQGFRGRDWTKDTQSAHRIIVLGHSTVFGHGASGDDKIFVSALERLLNDSAQFMEAPVEVLNAGVLGYGSTEELVLLVTHLLDYHPDLIIIMDGWMDLCLRELGAQGRQYHATPVFGIFDTILSRDGQRWANLMRLSAFYRMLERQLAERRQKGKRPPSFGCSSSNHGPYLARYRKNIERMIRIAKTFGCETILASQPELFHRKGIIPQAERKLRQKWERKEGYLDFVQSQLPTVITAAKEVALAEGVPFVDATKAFDSSEGVAFVDFAHQSDHGNELLARQFLPVVSQVLGQRVARDTSDISTTHA